MANELTVCTEQEVLGKQFRIYGTPEEPLFLARDVAEWIEHSNATVMLQSIDDSEKGLNNVYTLGGPQEMWFLTEDGLYEVLMQSRKPIAKQFKAEVKVILKSIRKHGGYLTPDKVEEVLSDPDTIIRLATQLKTERAARLQAEESQKILKVKIETDRPKVLFADAVSVAKTSILVGDFAKLVKQNGIEIGQKRLFHWLRERGYLIRQQGSSWNMPTQRAMELGIFEVKETAITHSDGHISISRTVKITGKGQVYLMDAIMKSQSLVTC